MSNDPTLWQDFKLAARLGEPARPPLALIVDSPWLAGYAGVNTKDFYLFPDIWFQIHRRLLDRFPGVVWIPGFWVEYGMAVEPSAFGVRIHWHDDRPPSLEPVTTSLEHWADAPLPNVHEDGLMPLVYRLYGYAEERLQAEGRGIKMVCARGPMVTAGWVMGISALMMGLVQHPALVHRFLDKVTTTIIRFLHAQLDTLREPEGIMLLDDIVGMVSLEHYEEFVEPYLQRIFAEFEGLVRVYHNDTPCPHLFPAFTRAGFDVFNFTYDVDLLETKKQIGHRIALMGNIPPLHVAVRERPETVYRWATNCLDRAARGGGLILSLGGGISPGMPAESIDAMLQAVRDWTPPDLPPEQIAPLRLSKEEKPARKTRRRPRRSASSPP
ncbi:MAG: uroporphyrinogen decarboxylase [Caldilineae bacterium]|nr:MAG: uroporphyrinogen decarboxylase [Caldilineae bacterium]